MGTRIAVIAAVVVALALVALPIMLAIAAPAGLAGFAPPAPETSSGEAINELYWFVVGICLVVFVLVESALVLFVLRFRRRGDTPADAEGPQIHGNTRLEIIWTAIPAVILAAIAIVVLVRTPAVQATGSSDEEELVVRVEAHQFYWQYVYPDGEIAIDTLVLPVDRPVRLEITSFDVDHSWWVPDLTGKRDAIPGRTIELRFTPAAEGMYEGKCAELCGILHAVMPTTVEVVSEATFQERMGLLGGQDQRGAAQLALGGATWDGVCARCHGLGGEGDIGPPIAKSGTLANEQALDEIVRNGQDLAGTPGIMPPVGAGWPPFQVRALMAYIRSNEALAPAQQQGQQEQEGSG